MQQGSPHNRPPAGADADEASDQQAISEKVTLELCFMSIVGAILMAAFIRSLSYDIVSARAPIVILVPLLILVGVRIHHLWKTSQAGGIKRALSRLASGRNEQYAKAAEFFGWTVLLLAFIYIGGHYAGIAVFMFILMKEVSEEKVVLSVSVTAGVTLALFLLFELGFEIELYRGLIYRIWAGYEVF